MSKKFIGFWNVSVILTYIELCIAVGCICLAADGCLWQPAVGLVLWGMIVCEISSAVTLTTLYQHRFVIPVPTRSAAL